MPDIVSLKSSEASNQPHVPSQIVTEALGTNESPYFDVIERLFFAYRDFTADCDIILSKFGFGRAHHRVLYFVNRRPGIRVADLLEILNITKQSLGRVLKQLIEDDFLVQQQGANDRRERLLFPTEKGRKLAVELSVPQSRRIHSALNLLSESEQEAARQFLMQLINAEERSFVEGLEDQHTK